MASNRRHRAGKIVLVIEIILIIIAIFIAIIAIVFGKLKSAEWDSGSVYMNEINDANISDYTNIALFGVDSRENDLTTNTRSDSIIIASINNKTKKIKLISIYRDTYVYIPEHGYTKLNHSYAYGGPKLAVETINRNFDLNIRDFVTVNFSALTDAIDALGGVDIEITKEELDYVNKYAKDVANINNKEWTKIKKPGMQTLTGVQATGYARVRYTKGGDFTRANRQRTVIEAMLKKAKHTNPAKLVKAANSVLPQICTGMSGADFTKLAVFFPFYSIDEQSGFPFDNKTMTINKASVVVSTSLASNVTKLHDYLFKTANYEPSQTVKDISAQTSKKS